MPTEPQPVSLAEVVRTAVVAEFHRDLHKYVGQWLARRGVEDA